MAKILFGGIGLFILFIVFLYVVGVGLDEKSRSLNAQANLEYTRAQAEAQIIRAQSQASLDYAQSSQANALATGIYLTTMLPWGVLFVVSLLGLGVLGLAFTLAYFRHSEVKQVVYQLPRNDTYPGYLSQKEMWQILANNRELILDKRIKE